jgi:2-isopropylmalate synthase
MKQSLMRLLQFLSSRPTTPIPFRPKRSNTMEIPSPDSSPKTNGTNGTNGTKHSIVDTLEAVVNGDHADVKSAGV